MRILKCFFQGLFLVLVLSLPVFAGFELTDTRGNRVFFEERPSRIVSAVPSATEIVCALGGGDMLAGFLKGCGLNF